MIENINRPDEPQPNIASKFLTRFDEEGFFTFQTFADCKTSNASYLTRILHGTFDEHHAELLRLNQLGAGIFSQLMPQMVEDAVELTSQKLELYLSTLMEPL